MENKKINILSYTISVILLITSINLMLPGVIDFFENNFQTCGFGRKVEEMKYINILIQSLVFILSYILSYFLFAYMLYKLSEDWEKYSLITIITLSIISIIPFSIILVIYGLPYSFPQLALPHHIDKYEEVFSKISVFYGGPGIYLVAITLFIICNWNLLRNLINMFRKYEKKT